MPLKAANIAAFVVAINLRRQDHKAVRQIDRLRVTCYISDVLTERQTICLTWRLKLQSSMVQA